MTLKSPAPTTRDKLVRAGIVCLPLYGVATLLSTLTHQPDYKTDFPAYAEYVTTSRFLIGHIFGSILGTAIGILGTLALYSVLSKTRAANLALLGLVLAIVGNCLILPLFGVAAFGQPAVGNAYLDGAEAAVGINDDMYGTPLFATALPGTLLYSLGAIVLGIAIWRSQYLPRVAAVLYALAIPLIAFIGIAYGPAQTPGSLMLIAAGLLISVTVLRDKTKATL